MSECGQTKERKTKKARLKLQREGITDDIKRVRESSKRCNPEHR